MRKSPPIMSNEPCELCGGCFTHAQGCPARVPPTLPEMVQASAPAAAASPDMVNSPPHYTSHPSGVECIAITEHFNFCIGNCMKYLWRAGLKGDSLEDLEKAEWYLKREITRRKSACAESRGTQTTETTKVKP